MATVDSIRPIVYEMTRKMEREVAEDTGREDDGVIDRLENYYYKEMDRLSLVKLTYEKSPSELSIEPYNERCRRLDVIEKAVTRKMTRIAAENYENFCKSLFMVQKIAMKVDEQEGNVRENRVLLGKKKRDFVEKVIEIAKVRKRLGSKRSVLCRLELIGSMFGGLLASYKRLVHEGNVESVVEFLGQRNRFMENERRDKEKVVNFDDELIGVYKKIKKLVDFGVDKSDRILNKQFEENVIPGGRVDPGGSGFKVMVEMSRKMENQGLFEERKIEILLKRFMKGQVNGILRTCLELLLDHKDCTQVQKNVIKGILTKSKEHIAKKLNLLEDSTLEFFFENFFEKFDEFQIRVKPVIESTDDQDLKEAWINGVISFSSQVLSRVNEENLVKLEAKVFTKIDTIVSRHLGNLERSSDAVQIWEKRRYSYLKKFTMMSILNLLNNLKKNQVVASLVNKVDLKEKLGYLYQNLDKKIMKNIEDLLTGDRLSFTTDVLLYHLNKIFTILHLKEYFKFFKNESKNDPEKLREKSRIILEKYSQLFIALFVVYYAQLLFNPTRKKKLIHNFNFPNVNKTTQRVWENSRLVEELNFHSNFKNTHKIFNLFLQNEDNENNEEANYKKHCVTILKDSKGIVVRSDDYSTKEIFAKVVAQLISYKEMIRLIPIEDCQFKETLDQSIEEIINFSYLKCYSLYPYTPLMIENLSKRKFSDKTKGKKAYLEFLCDEIEGHKRELGYVLSGYLPLEYQNTMLACYKSVVLRALLYTFQEILRTENFSSKAIGQFKNDLALVKEEYKVAEGDKELARLNKLLKIDDFIKEKDVDKLAEYFVDVFMHVKGSYLVKFKSRFLEKYVKENEGKLAHMVQERYLLQIGR